MRFSSKIERCEQTPIRKFAPYAEAAAKRGVKIYHLNIGQPDVRTPREFFDAVSSFPKPVLAYGPSRGEPEYLEAVRKYYAAIGVELETRDVFATTGGSESLMFTLMAILDEGDELLVPEPYYPNYDLFTNITGGRIVPIPTSPEEGYRFAERERIEPLITERTRGILFTNPGNPTGYVLSHEEMRVMADIAKEHDLFLIADEVYREFAYGGEPLRSMAQFDDIDEQLVVVDSASKRFSACGARIGAIITKNQRMQDEIMKLCQSRLCPPTLDQYGATALYGVDPAYFTGVREEYKRRRDVSMEKLSAILGAVCVCPGGAFYMMVKLPVDDSEELLKFLLDEFTDNGETVMYAPGGGFYGGRKGFDEIRIAYVLNEKDMARALDLLKLGIEAYNKKKQTE